MKKLYFLGLVLGLAVLIGSILLEGISLFIFFAAAAILISFGIPLSVTIFSFGPKVFGKAFKTVFNPDPKTTSVKRALAVIDCLGKTAVGAGILGTIAGIVLILSNLSDISQFGRGLAVSLLCLFYAGLIQVFVIIPFKAGLKSIE
jgi:flagellar motor component MotA